MRYAPPYSCSVSRSHAAAILALMLAWGLASPPVRGETLYVSDRLLLGVHQGKEVDSAIKKVLPSGTAVEVLKRDAELVRVKTPDGVTGWVDGKYLMDEKPARLVVEELEAWRRTRKEELAAAWAEVETLRKQLADGGQAPSQGSEGVTSTLKELQRLQDENRGLRETLEEARTQLADLAMRRGDPRSAESVPPGARGVRLAAAALLPSGPWRWVLGGSLFLFGFGLGAYALDAAQRRRHGGFRV